MSTTEQRQLDQMEARLQNTIKSLTESMAHKSEMEYVGIKKDLDYILQDIREIKKTMSENYVTRAEFTPIQKIAYGLVGLVLVSVAGAVMTGVLK